MSRTKHVCDSVIVDAEPRTLYDQISDPTKMGTLSPENRGATVAEPREAAYVGMVFDGHNKRGRFTWTTRCTVTKAVPGEVFAFRVHAIGPKTPRIKGRVATWQYTFEPVKAGTKVTESWTDDRKWPDAVAAVFDKAATGTTFAAFQERNIAKTLSNLQAAFEVSR